MLTCDIMILILLKSLHMQPFLSVNSDKLNNLRIKTFYIIVFQINAFFLLSLFSIQFWLCYQS